MEMEVSVSRSRPVMAMAIRASAKDEPDAPWGRRGLVDVVLQTIARDVSGECAGARQRAGFPGQTHRDEFHVVSVCGCQSSNWADGERALVHDAGVAVG